MTKFFCQSLFTTPIVIGVAFGNTSRMVIGQSFQFLAVTALVYTYSLKQTRIANAITSIINFGILFVKFVTLFAMSLFSTLSRHSFTSKNIDLFGRRFNMYRVNTFAITAQMVTVQQRVNFFYKQLINNSMYAMVRLSTIFKRSVSALVGVASPFPTRNVVVETRLRHLNLGKDAGQQFSSNGKFDKLSSGHIISLITNSMSRLGREANTLCRAIFILPQNIYSDKL